MNKTTPDKKDKRGLFCLLCLLLLSTYTIASAKEGIQEALINTTPKSTNTTNISSGSRNHAQHSSPAIKQVSLRGHVVNQIQGKDSTNLTAGEKNAASKGSVVISRSKVTDNIVHQAQTKRTINIASGKANEANQGAVRIQSASIQSPMYNDSRLQEATNIATGEQNIANQASIVVKNATIYGVVTNDGHSLNAFNTAQGFSNTASQSSVIIDEEPVASRHIELQTRLEENQYVTTENPVPSEALKTKTLRPPLQKRQPPPPTPQNVQPLYVPEQVIFSVANTAQGLEVITHISQKYRLTIVSTAILHTLDQIMVISTTDRDVREVSEALKKERGVETSQPNYIFSTSTTKEPLDNMQHIVSMLDLQAVHKKITGKGVTVAVVDTGIELAHEDLRNRIVAHHNFVPASSYHGEIHGTAVAGIIAASSNGLGILGIAPEVNLLALRACQQLQDKKARGRCFSTSIVRSVDTAIRANVDIVNMSLGCQAKDPLLTKMIDAGNKKGLIFTAPVGNTSAGQQISFPASHGKVVSVAGFDESGRPLPNATLAARAKTVAPATNLLTTTPESKYNFMDGTSLASASISGLLSLSIQKRGRQNAPACLPHFNQHSSWSRRVLNCLGIQEP